VACRPAILRRWSRRQWWPRAARAPACPPATKGGGITTGGGPWPPSHVHGWPSGGRAGGGDEPEANDGGERQLEHQHVRPHPWEHLGLPKVAHDALAMCGRSRECDTRWRCSALPARVMRRGSGGYARMRGRWRLGALLSRMQEGAWRSESGSGSELCSEMSVRGGRAWHQRGGRAGSGEGKERACWCPSSSAAGHRARGRRWDARQQGQARQGRVPGGSQA
jgi:hypothetical protein